LETSNCWLSLSRRALIILRELSCWLIESAGLRDFGFPYPYPVEEHNFIDGCLRDFGFPYPYPVEEDNFIDGNPI